MKPATFEQQMATLTDTLSVNDERLYKRFETLTRRVDRIAGELSNLQLRHDNLLSTINLSEDN